MALLSEGYHVIAMDYVESAIQMTREKCHKIGRDDVCLIRNEGLAVPLSEDSVDAIIADGSLFFYEKDNIIKTLTNLYRVMKKDALLWTNFRTKQDSLYGKGTQLTEGLFVLHENTNREGCAYYFADEEDIREMFSLAGFEIISIDDFSYTTNNKSVHNCWYHVVGKKN